MKTTKRTFIHGAMATALALTLAPAAKGGLDLDRAGGDDGTNLQALATAACQNSFKMSPLALRRKCPLLVCFMFLIRLPSM